MKNEIEFRMFIESVEDLLKLIDDGVLVRDTSGDNDFIYFTNQATRIVKVLGSVQNNLEKIKILS